ncbi:MAG TPA: DUF1343 domain-containing protein, partial [Elusimicrobiota bacterium]|nr:DUF1343 domain-containing protein [Elusimicrobiota bacterium]
MRAAILVLALCLPRPARAAVQAGIDVLEHDGFAELKGKRVGLITNPTGVDRSGRPTWEILATAPDVQLVALFAPEHGALGKIEDRDVSSGTWTLPGGRQVPLYSLYGATKAPTTDMLAGLDALVFDIQDIGARFYTYDSTMGMALEAAAHAGKEFVVLDRPNPIGGDIVEGAMLDPGIRHFTAYFPVTTRHGLTVGEIARLHDAVLGLHARLSVVRLEGWHRDMWHDETGLKWVPPSPNMPNLDAAALYPGIGCLEATNMSVGRGTPVPFRWIGAPWLDSKALAKRMNAAKLPGVKFSAESSAPTKVPFKGLRCPGLRIKITDRDALRPVTVFAHLVTALRDL